MWKNWGIARGTGRGPGHGMRLGIVVAATLALAAVLLVGSAPAAPGGARRLAAHPGASASDAPVRLGPTDPSRDIAISLMLAGQSQADLQRTLAAINDPRSPEYRHYLSPAEYARRFGASPATQAQAVSLLRAAGLTVADQQPSASTMVRADGTVGRVESLFGVRLYDYRASDGEIYFAPEAAPLIPAALRGVATSVLGLDTRPLFHRADLRAVGPAADRPAPRLLDPTILRKAYNIQPLTDAGLDGSGQTLAFAEIDTFKQSDIDTYDRTYNISAPQVEVVKVRGGARPAKQVSETTLDIEVVHAIAPRTKLLSYGSPADFGSLLQNFDTIVRENRAQVMSVSLGGCENAIVDAGSQGQQFLQALSDVFQRAAAQGMSVFVASGDTGAYTCRQSDPGNSTVSVSIPADNPWVTAVGGTALFLNSDGSYGYEAGWEGPLEGSGGGGGVSVAYSRPDWQTGPGVDNQFSNGHRQLPDIAAAADPLTGYRIYDSTGNQCSGDECWGAVGGTSAAAPLWAAITVLANQQAGKSGKQPMGFINPQLYRMGRGEVGQPPFHDVLMGGNLYYDAGAGWDYSTGWGTPNAEGVVRGLVASK